LGYRRRRINLIRVTPCMKVDFVMGDTVPITQLNNKKPLWCLGSVLGFTIIELMITIAIAATMMGLAVSYLGSSYRIQIKKETSHLVGAIKFVYNEAATKNFFYRIVFDLDEQAYWVESSDQPFYVTTYEEEEEKKKSKKEKEEGAEDEAKSASGFTEADQEVVKKIKLDKEVKIRDVYVAHQEGIVTEGQAHLYFFPAGLTELAIIHFSNEDEEENFSIIVNPITGRCKVEAGYVDPETLELEES